MASSQMNSGILYLENFIDSVHTLPADYGRLLAYIRTLDDKCTGTFHYAAPVSYGSHTGQRQCFEN